MKLHASEITGSLNISGSITPNGSGSWDLGSPNAPWKDLHVMSSSIHIYDATGPIAKLGAVRGKGFSFKDNTGALTRITGSHMKLSGNAKVVGTVTAGEFSGGGAGITGVTAEWDGTHTGNGVITGNFDVSGNISGSSTSTGSFGQLRISNTTNAPMAKLVVGTTAPNAGSSVVAQFDGSIRLENYLIMHDSSNNSNAIGWFYNTNNMLELMSEGSGTKNLYIPGNVSGSASSTGSFGEVHVVDKVGIGTTSPHEKLTISGGDIAIESGRGLRGPSGTEQYQVHTSDGLKFRTGGNERMRINTSGKVGIGTTSPSSPLHIKAPSTGIQFRIDDSNNDKLFTITETASSTDGNAVLDLYNRAHTSVIKLDSESGEVSYINTGGNVGIGTTSPDETLHVKKSSSNSVVIESVTDDSRLYIRTGDEDSTPALQFQAGGDFMGPTNRMSVQWNGWDDQGEITSNDGPLVLEADDELILKSKSGTHTAVLDRSGYFGIGTSIPSASLHVSASGIGDALFVSGSGGSPQVGIGTTSPDVMLHVKETSSGLARVYIEGTDPDLRFIDTNHKDWMLQANSDNLSIIGNDAADTYVTFEDGGNVGIGVTDPDTILDVFSASAKQAQFSGWSSGNAAESSNSGEILIGTDSFGTRIQFAPSTGGDNIRRTYIDNTYDAAAAEMRFRMRTSGTDVDAMTILGSGNVGIGVTDPDSILEVAGTAHIQGVATFDSTIGSGAITSTGLITGTDLTISGTSTTIGTVTSGIWNAGAVTSTGAISGTTGTFTGDVQVGGGSNAKELKVYNTGAAVSVYNSANSTRYQYMVQNSLVFENAGGNVKTLSTTDLNLGTNNTSRVVIDGTTGYMQFNHHTKILNGQIHHGVNSGGNMRRLIGFDGALCRINDEDQNTLIGKDGTTVTIGGDFAVDEDSTFAGDLTVAGGLTINGTTTIIDTVNMSVSESLIELNRGATTNINDSGFYIERGSTGDNALFVWDESEDGFITGTTTASGSASGSLTITAAPLQTAALTSTTGTFSGNVSLNKDDGYLYLNNAGTSNSGVYIRGKSDDTMRCLVPAGKFFEWEVGGVQKFKLDSSGNATFTGLVTAPDLAITGTSTTIGTVTSGIWNAGAVTSTGGITGTTGVFYAAGNGNSPILHVKDTSDTFVALFEGNRAADTGAEVKIRHWQSTAAENARTMLSFEMKDDGNNVTTYGQIFCGIDDYTGGTEDGNFTIKTISAGSLTDKLTINSSGATFTGQYLNINAGGAKMAIATNTDAMHFLADTNNNGNINPFEWWHNNAAIDGGTKIMHLSNGGDLWISNDMTVVGTVGTGTLTTTGNATFAGDITRDGDSDVVMGNSTLQWNMASNLGSRAWMWRNDVDAWGDYGLQRSNAHDNTIDTAVLLFDASSNATFAGSLGIAGGTASTDYGIATNKDIKIIKNGARLLLGESTGAGAFGCVTWNDSANTISLGTQAGGETTQLVLDGSGNATFAGTVKIEDTLNVNKGNFYAHIQNTQTELKFKGDDGMDFVFYTETAADSYASTEAFRIGDDRNVTFAGNIDVSKNYIVNEQGRQDHVANTMSQPYYRFNGGQTTTINCGAGTNFPTGDFTYSCWIYMDVLNIGHIGGNYGYGFTSGIQFSVNASGLFSVYIGAAVQSTTAVSAGKWNHVAYTRSGTAVTVYVNGLSDATGTNATAINSGGYFSIGNSYNAQHANESLTGQIAGARIYNNALTATEVKELYSGASVPFKYKGANQTNLFDADAAAGTVVDKWAVQGSNTIAVVSNAIAITYVNDDAGALLYLRDSYDLTSDLTVGKRYRLTVDAKYTGGSSGSQLRIFDTVNHLYSGALTTSMVKYTWEFTAYSATGCYLRCHGMASSNVVTIDNLSIIPIGAVAEYDGTGATGATWYDKSGNNYDGTVANATLENRATALIVDDRVGIGTTSPDANHLLTLKGSAVGDDFILCQQSDGGQAFRMGLDSSNDGFFEIGSDTASSQVLLQADGISHFMGGYVGIGTASPGEILTLDSSSNTRLLLREGGTDMGTIAAGGGGLYITNKAGDIIFRNSSDADTVRIKNSGYVGIGTTAPDAKLDIHGGSIHIHTDGTNEIAFGNTSHTEEWAFVYDGGGQGDISLQSYSDAWYNVMFWDRSNQRVGIGYTDPATTLEVKDGFAVTSTNTGGAPRFWMYDYGNDNESANIQFHKSKSGTRGTHAVVADGTDLGRIAFYASDGDSWEASAEIKASIDGAPGNSDIPGRLTFATAADGAGTTTERMRITNAGNIGIGTTSPLSQLHVSSGANFGTDFARGSAQRDETITVLGDDAGIDIVSNEGGGYGSNLNFKEVNGTTFRNSWSITRTTGTTPSLIFGFGTSVDATGNLGNGLTITSTGNATFAGELVATGKIEGGDGMDITGDVDVSGGIASGAHLSGLTLESAGIATFGGLIYTVQAAHLDGIRFRGYDAASGYYGKIGLTDSGYLRIHAEGNRSIDLYSGRQIRFFTSTDNSTYNNSVNFNSDGSSTFTGTINSGAITSTAGISGTTGTFSTSVIVNNSAPWNNTNYFQVKSYSNSNLIMTHGDAQGRIGFGVAPSGTTLYNFGGTMSHRWTGGSGVGMFINIGHTPSTSQWVYGNVLSIRGAITAADGNANPWHMGTMMEPPTITDNGGTVVKSATLRITGAMTHATYDYSLYVDSGDNYFGGSTSFGSTIDVAGNATFNDVLPSVDGTKDLGSPSLRWANVYTGDLHLKNEVGDWTVEEGAEELFIRNNLTGKKYAIMMKEVE